MSQEKQSGNRTAKPSDRATHAQARAVWHLRYGQPVLIDGPASWLRQEIGKRGLTSVKAGELKDAKDKLRRPKSMHYESVEDRYSCDAIDYVTESTRKEKGCKAAFDVICLHVRISIILGARDSKLSFSNTLRNLAPIVSADPHTGCFRFLNIYEVNHPEILENIRKKGAQSAHAKDQQAKKRKAEHEEQQQQDTTACSSGQPAAPSTSSGPEPGSTAVPAAPSTARADALRTESRPLGPGIEVIMGGTSVTVEAINHAGLFRGRGQRLDIISVNALCNACAKAGRWQSAISLLAQELEQYTIVISALGGQSRPWTTALDLFASAKAVKGRQAQDVVLLSAVLNAVPWRRGHELLREAHDVADGQLFNTAMCASARCQQWLLTFCQVVMMAQKSLQPDVFSVSAAVNAQEFFWLNLPRNVLLQRRGLKPQSEAASCETSFSNCMICISFIRRVADAAAGWLAGWLPGCLAGWVDWLAG
eukprot:s3403_g6.t1